MHEDGAVPLQLWYQSCLGISTILKVDMEAHVSTVIVVHIVRDTRVMPMSAALATVLYNLQHL